MLERKLTIDDLKVGDIVATEGRYLTSKGYYFRLGRAFRVKRINRKSVTLAPLELIDDKWTETDVVRIPREAEEQGWLKRKAVQPLFARDNSRC